MDYFPTDVSKNFEDISRIWGTYAGKIFRNPGRFLGFFCYSHLLLKNFKSDDIKRWDTSIEEIQGYPGVCKFFGSARIRSEIFGFSQIFFSKFLFLCHFLASLPPPSLRFHHFSKEVRFFCTLFLCSFFVRILSCAVALVSSEYFR